MPDLVAAPRSKDADQIRVQTLIDYVTCDVKRSVQQVLLDSQDINAIRASAHLPPVDLSWLDDWAAQITFTLTVEEKSQFNPGISLTKLYPGVVTKFANATSVTSGQTFTLGLAAAYSTDATRKETISIYLDFKKLLNKNTLAKARRFEQDGKLPLCERNLNGQFQPEIKFMDWLNDALLGTYVQNGVADYSRALQDEGVIQQRNVLSHDITFVVIYGGNVTPTWTLAHFTGSTTSPLFGAQRTNTQDVTITLGPVAKGIEGQALAAAAQDTTLASQIGIAVANSIRSAQ